MNSEKTAYAAPAIEDLGSVHEMTLGQSTGNALDHTFPAGTPFSALTFSG